MALFAFCDFLARRAASFSHGEQCRLAVERFLVEARGNCLELATAEAALLRGANRSKASLSRGQHKSLWPGAVISGYDQRGEAVLLSSADSVASAAVPKPRGIRDILEKNGIFIQTL